MAHSQIEHLLDEISRLFAGEREDLIRALPQASLPSANGAGNLTIDAVQHAVAVRERVRRRLHAQHQRLGSVDVDLEAAHEERLSRHTQGVA